MGNNLMYGSQNESYCIPLDLPALLSCFLPSLLLFFQILLYVVVFIFYILYFIFYILCFMFYILCLVSARNIPLLFAHKINTQQRI